MARKIVNRKTHSTKTAAKQSVAIVSIQAEQPNTLPTSEELPLAYLATASKLSLQTFWLKHLASAAGLQHQAAEAIRDAVDKLAAAKLAESGVYVGEFVNQCRQLASAESFYRAAADALSAAVDELAGAKLARLAIDGTLERTHLHLLKDAAKGKLRDAQYAFLRIRAGAILRQEEGGELQPYFQPKPLSDEIMRQCRVDRRKAWRLYFKLYGCKDCKQIDADHEALGYCTRCYKKIKERWYDIIKYPKQFED